MAPIKSKPKPKTPTTTKAKPKLTKPKQTKPKQTKATATDKPLNLSARTLWPKTTELLSLAFSVYPLFDCALYAQYTIGLHAWFLQQIQARDAELSAYMHDRGSEKPFSISGLSGQFVSNSQSLQLQKDKTYRWKINGLCQPVAQGIAAWLRELPDEIDLKDAPLAIESVRLVQPATTYAKLLTAAKQDSGTVSLSFISPTSFRRKGHHLPLPWPTNVFHSYLRRWNHFARNQVDPDTFLEWVDQHVIVHRHTLESVKVAAGKQGSVTGFTGAVTYQLDRQANEQPDFQSLFYALVRLAPFCGTGHKTTFGLGETHLGWQESAAVPAVPTGQLLLAERIEELTALFVSMKKRQGGKRAQDTAQKWATILARREQGDGLDAIARDMDLGYETAKTYAKLARRALREGLPD
ncbi:MAG: CRISPR-associated endoribonuclease Cas6 [Phormidesmis sp. RL_2_1]|nr:CRISPR-associated endoribonuclease Cas6 [Phormidesmis sp. RL_2_1]